LKVKKLVAGINPETFGLSRITVILAVNQRLTSYSIYHCIMHYATKQTHYYY